MTLAESILGELNSAQNRADKALAQAKAEYEAAKGKYDEARAAQFACEGENYDELRLATARAEGEMQAYKRSYDYYAGGKDAVELLSIFLRAKVEIYGKPEPDFFDEELPA